jgi:positive regulator of sigma E activity
MPKPPDTTTRCAGQCDRCDERVAQDAACEGIPEGWRRTVLWAVVFVWPLLWAIAGAVLAGRLWDSNLAQLAGALIGLALGVLEAMVTVRYVLRRYASKHERNTYEG